MNRKKAEAIYRAGRETVVQTLCELSKETEKLRNRVKQLEEQLAKNSRNSSKPPSSDGLKKPTKPPSSDKRQKERKEGKGSKLNPGGQNGHEGNGLQAVSQPDYVLIHPVLECQECGRPLKDQEAL